MGRARSSQRGGFVVPVLILGGFLGGCVDSEVVKCQSDDALWYCPAGMECHPGRRCIHPRQRTDCAGAADGTPCSYPGAPEGQCVGELCISLDEPYCGNGSVDVGEACDGVNLADQSCESRGFSTGTLRCGADCRFDESACAGRCGDGRKSPDEVCDGEDVGGLGCADVAGLAEGHLGCSPTCQALDVSGCHECGNGILEAHEVCDGTVAGELTCTGMGFPGGGVVRCGADCALDTEACCQDLDGDGHGAHCDRGDDCDDTLIGITGECRADGCPPGFVLVPAGDFWRGCNANDPCWAGQANESPRHLVTLSAFCMAETETSVAAFRACITAGVCTGIPNNAGSSAFYNWSADPADRESHPVNGITWEDAQQYCLHWIGGSLPTEAQWEKAARGPAPGFPSYPWGDSPAPDCDRGNFDVNASLPGDGCGEVQYGTGAGTWPVDRSFSLAGVSPYGIRDLAGNLEEWVLDWYEADVYDDCAGGCTNPANVGQPGTLRVIRGGAFTMDNPAYLRASSRYGIGPQFRAYGTGFRCVRGP